MATRLDRLLVLLESGSTPVARKAAAEQIGEIQKLHPHELNNLLRKISKFLKHKSWDTRIAAGQAVEAIAKNVRKWSLSSPSTPSPKGSPSVDDVKMEDSETESIMKDIELLSFDKFDITQVLQYGTPLLSSTGEEFAQLDSDPDYQKMSFQEKASFHRQQLKEKLGLVAQGKVFSTGLEQLFDDNDLVLTHRKPLAQKPIKQENEISELSMLSGMSARERNRAKRKARMAARKNTRDKEDDQDSINTDGPPTKKAPQTSSVLVEQSGDTDKVLIDQVRDPDMIFEDSNEWPFTWFCEEMFCQLFNPQWEFRHGAASALREIIKLHGDTAGWTATVSSDERQNKTQCWLTDVAIRLLCVFALDRFADFVSDQVVAPVRATCAQVLGIVCHKLDTIRVDRVINTLLTLVQQDMWEVRHAALMGIQHLLASRMDLTQSLLPIVADSILNGLHDSDDDVRAVAAGSLLPVADKLYTILKDKILILLNILWDSLLKLDDLSASTGAVMDLLSNLFVSLQQHTDVSHTLLPDHSLITYIPRIYPFLSHTISSVRFSSLSTIKNLLTTRAIKDSSSWIQELLDGVVSQVFQRLALEGDEAIRNLCLQVWDHIIELSSAESLAPVLSAHLIRWLSMLVTSCHLSVDPTVLVGALAAKQLRDESRTVFLGGCLGVESMAIKDQSAFAARVAATRALGSLAHKVFPTCDDTTSQYFLDSLRQMSQSNNATYKVIASLVIVYWRHCPSDVVETLLGSLNEQILYEELAPFLLSLQKECHYISLLNIAQRFQVLISAFDKKGKDVTGGVNPSGYTADFAVQLASVTYNNALQSLTLTEQEKQDFDSYHRNLLTTLGQLQEQHQALQGRVQCCSAGSLITVSSLPKKLTPVIKPLMECLKAHSDSLMQSLGAEWLSRLLDLCRERTPCPNSKIIKNICGYVYCDVNHTPSVQLVEIKSLATEEDIGLTPSSGIISLIKYMRKVSSFARRKGRGRPSVAVREAMAEAASLSSGDNAAQAVQRAGGEVSLSSMAKYFGDNLFTSLPQLWSEMTGSLPVDEKRIQDSTAQCVVNALQVLEVLSLTVHHGLKSQILSLFECLKKCLVSNFTAVRHMAARCISSYAKLDLHATMKFLLDEILPCLGDTVPECRQGAIEAIGCLLDCVGMTTLCYIVFLIMPVLGKMSDQQRDIRLMASQCFAQLVTLMPLESGAESPPEMLPELSNRRVSERKFLEQLLDTKKLETYRVAVPINADLRKYQQDGINWLAFLNRYNLHGILCDDMGLGKTLQSICIIASDHVERKKKFEATGQTDCTPLPSIVVCPPTLTGHWAFEVKKFCSQDHLNALQYHGPSGTRTKLQKQVPNHNLVIVSYDVIRNDIDFFRTIHWNYCILDEGHIIKNTRTKITKAVKVIKANHRLILSGTPIQNNVLELWSLFDFLMPGFLGTERQFNERFGRPILLSRDAKSSSKEQEAGALAMENLHRQVLPFLLRRMKEDVLQDLPPKIIQDYHCDLSPLQVQLYEDFARSRAQKQVEEQISDDQQEMETTPTGKKEKKQGETHIFQALQYLRKVCNHPALVVTPTHPMYSKVMEYLKKEKTTIHNINHSSKLLALKQLLNECGIGVDDTGDNDQSLTSGSVVSQHRVLLFCQYKSILDIIESDLFKVHMPSVTYLRLDGSVPANSRHDLVQRFNLDPSIDVLLLTTHVGGLGLNLTGADTVIFFEHDWNPMKDLQAMDRAHRIGQKRVVNVYRLITRGTLEEKIMSLQKFKLNIANTVITQENSSLLSMNTSDILDLFQLGENVSDVHHKTISSSDQSGSGNTLKTILEGMPNLWDEEQYGGEYDMNKFMKSLATTKNNN